MKLRNENWRRPTRSFSPPVPKILPTKTAAAAEATTTTQEFQFNSFSQFGQFHNAAFIVSLISFDYFYYYYIESPDISSRFRLILFSHIRFHSFILSVSLSFFSFFCCCWNIYWKWMVERIPRRPIWTRRMFTQRADGSMIRITRLSRWRAQTIVINSTRLIWLIAVRVELRSRFSENVEPLERWNGGTFGWLTATLRWFLAYLEIRTVMVRFNVAAYATHLHIVSTRAPRVYFSSPPIPIFRIDCSLELLFACVTCIDYYFLSFFRSFFLLSSASSFLPPRAGSRVRRVGPALSRGSLGVEGKGVGRGRKIARGGKGGKSQGEWITDVDWDNEQTFPHKFIHAHTHTHTLLTVEEWFIETTTRIHDKDTWNMLTIEEIIEARADIEGLDQNFLDEESWEDPEQYYKSAFCPRILQQNP